MNEHAKPLDPRPTILLEMAPLDAEMVRAHPDVLLAEEAGGDRIAVWLLPGAEDFDIPATRYGLRPEPARRHELEFFGDGESHPTFWRRWPGIEHLMVLSDPDSADGPPWWGVRIWLTEEAAEMAGITREAERERVLSEF